MTDLILHLLYAVGLYAALTIVQAFLWRLKLLRQLPVGLNLVFFLLAAKIYAIADLARIHPYVRNGLEAGLLTVSTYVVLRLLDGIFFEHILGRRRERAVPVVVRDILRWLLFALAVFVILRALFPTLNLNFIAVSSIVIGYIVGNATQDTLGNLVAGLAMSSDAPFSVGDWVVVGDRTGQVVDMTWRAVRLITRTFDYIIIPNSVIAKEQILNYTQPTRVHGVYFRIGASYDAAPNHVRRVLFDVFRAVPDVLQDPPPKVYLEEYGDFAIVYRCKIVVDDFEKQEITLSRVMDLIWYHFKREGISIPFPIRDVRITHNLKAVETGQLEAACLAERRAAVDRIELFQPLSDTERAHVAAQLQSSVFAVGETLVRQGDEGRTFFILCSGRVRISAVKDGQEIVIAHLGEGSFFGEMSLLTGEKRNATITAETDTRVFVLTHNVLADLLRQNARLAEDLAQQLEKRQKQYGDSVGAAGAAKAAAGGSRSAMVDRIRRFFGLT